MIKIFLLGLMLMAIILPTSAQENTARDWDGQSRYTVLVMGLDRRPQETGLSVRTDVMIVLSLDPANERLGALSIPRDMHFAMINSPEILVRVNSLVLRGENQEVGGGFDYALQNIQYNLGMYIDAYIAFDFVAFEMFIDAIGGLPIDVPYTISDPTYPDMNHGFDPFYIRPGSYVMDGDTALKYARSRHGGNDYIRGQRQLDVIEATLARLQDSALVQRLILNAPALFTQLEGHIYTNMSPSQVITLGLGALQFQNAEFTRGALDEDYSFSYPYQTGRVRVPDRTLLGALMEATFGAEYWR